jgi:DNA processing protein
MGTGAKIPADARGWLALASMPGVGPARFLSLLSAFGSPRAALEASPEEWASIPGIGRTAMRGRSTGVDEKAIDAQVRQLEKSGASMAVLGGDDYPPTLARISQAPPFFFYRGEFPPADTAAIAIVGSRSPSPYGRRMATALSDGLARAGLTIVSGLAQGIDGAAHHAALDAGGRTIAVLGCGLDIVYPRAHRQLAENITENGVLISEFLFGTPPTRENFPKRNRIISGLSLGVVIVEARGVSGALHTARHALEQDREVFAVPGPAGSDLSVGTNNLIKAGARLVTDAADVLGELGMTSIPRRKTALPFPKLTPVQEKVYRRLSETPCHIDQLAVNLSVSAGELSTVLLDLELLGVVGQAAGKQFFKTR